MSFSYSIKQFYFQSRAYMLFSLFQIVLTLLLLVYILTDCQANLNKIEVLTAEFIIAFLMIADVLLHRLTTRESFGWLALAEYSVVICFLITFGYILYNGMAFVDEAIEFTLMVVRLLLQSARVVIGLARAKESRATRAASVDIHIDDTEARIDEPSPKEDVVAVEL